MSDIETSSLTLASIDLSTRTKADGFRDIIREGKKRIPIENEDASGDFKDAMFDLRHADDDEELDRVGWDWVGTFEDHLRVSGFTGYTEDGWYYIEKTE